MKIALPSTFCCLIFLLIEGMNAFAQEKSGTLESTHFSGSVKSATTVTYYAIDSAGVLTRGTVKEGLDNSIFYAFNQDGIVINEVISHANGQKYKERKFNEAGYLTQAIDFQDGKPAYFAEHVWDGERKQSSRFYSIDGDTSFQFYQYNKDNLLEKMVQIESDSSISHDKRYHYDDQNRKVGYEWRRGGGLDYRETYRYDDENRLIGLCVFDWKGEEKYCREMAYDSKGNLISEITHVEGAFTHKIEITYDDSGNRLSYKSFDSKMDVETDMQYEYENSLCVQSIQRNANGEVTKIEKFDYDEKGNLIAAYFLNGKGETLYVHRYKYEFDQAGNWIQKLMYDDKKVYYITERKITYY